MTSLLKWIIRNTPAMNTLMVATLVVGAISMLSMRREVFPEFDLEMILVTVPYPGASPAEVEEGICQKIEEAVHSIDGLKKVTGVAAEGAGSVVIELESDVEDVQKVLAEVRSEIDRIPSFPELAEDPEVEQVTIRRQAIRVGILGPDDESPEAEWRLRELAEKVRDDITRLPEVSQAELVAARQYQIDIEIPEETLRRHGLTLRQIAEIVRRENLELPGGTIKTEAGDVLVKGRHKQVSGEGIEQLTLLSRPDGTILTVGDLGTVSDGFDDSSARSWVNGQPAQVISIDRTSREDVLQLTSAVRAYVTDKQLPDGYRLMVWGDESIDVRDRLELLAENGLLGLVLVFLVLAVFLELRLAFWVALGVPFSILGACVVLLAMGQTLNMLSTFGFLMALGILVDDAIVIGENIYAHRQQGKSFMQGAIDGTIEVLPSIAASVCTTVIAFMPLLFVVGIMGKFIAVLPIAVIAMLLISLFESTFILPCHLAHGHEEDAPPPTLTGRARQRMQAMPPLRRMTFGMVLVGGAALLSFFSGPLQLLAAVLKWINQHAQVWLDGVISRAYAPSVRWALRNPATVIAASLGILLITVGVVRSGLTPFIIFPRTDSKTLTASLTFPDGTPSDVTLDALSRIEQSAVELNNRYEQETGKPIFWLYRRTVGSAESQSGPGRTSTKSGSNLGSVVVELVDSAERDVTSEQVVREWREAAGQFAGVESLTFGSRNRGPGGTPIEFKLLAKAEQVEQLERAVARVTGAGLEDGQQGLLEKYAGVHDIADDSRPGKWEFQLSVKPGARAMGIPLRELAETVRASYYGDEVMRLQRGRHEVKLMVRYPRADRRSLSDFHEIRVRSNDGLERPLTEIADVQVQRSYSEINRVDQLRSITITADVDEARANAREIVADLQRNHIPALLAEFPAVSVRWEGQQEQTTESVQSLLFGFGVALMAMFLLLTFEFGSYGMPLLIMGIIPFGVVGAIGGHLLMGMPITLFSLFGIVALTGVVVNDSIVLIDFINHRVRRDGAGLEDALIEAGCRRFRPVMLTSVTTIAGLLPMLLETSFQAQILIPMATSLAFGLMLATVLVLVLVPVFYLLYAKAFGIRGIDETQEAAEPAPSANQPHGSGDSASPLSPEPAGA